MEKHFYFFRHGQTNENQLGKREGTGIDSFLTDTGKMQALKLADFLADKHLDVIYSSPFKRAIDTAQIVASKYKSIDILTDECLSEIAFGFWNIEDAKKQEKMNENYNKIRTCLEQIVLSDEYKNVAISSHGGVTRALCFVAGVKIGMIENCQCFHFLFENGEWKYMEEFSTDINVNNLSDL